MKNYQKMNIIAGSFIFALTVMFLVLVFLRPPVHTASANALAEKPPATKSVDRSKVIYYVAYGYSPEDLTRSVSLWTKMGYEPVGGVAVGLRITYRKYPDGPGVYIHQLTYTQALVKRLED